MACALCGGRGPRCSTGTIVVTGSTASHSQPQPEHLAPGMAAGAQLIKLDMGEREVAQPVLMQPLRLLSGPREPARDGGRPMPEDAHRGAHLQPFGQGQCAQSFAAAPGWRREPIERGVPAATDLGAAGLTQEILDARGRAMMPIAAEGLHPRVGATVVAARGVGAGMALGDDAFGWARPLDPVDSSPPTKGGRHRRPRADAACCSRPRRRVWWRRPAQVTVVRRARAPRL